MKYLVKFFVVTLLILISTHAFAEQKIAFMDFKFILNNSKAGKGAQIYLKDTFTDNQKKLVELEKKLKKQESDLLGQKTVLSEEEYKKQTDNLRKEVVEYQKERKESLNQIAKLRTDARAKLIEKIDPILKSYMSENEISFVINKNIVILAGNEHNNDITMPIVKILDKELPSLNLK